MFRIPQRAKTITLRLLLRSYEGYIRYIIPPSEKNLSLGFIIVVVTVDFLVIFLLSNLFF
jgi:hypothetical protein